MNVRSEHARNASGQYVTSAAIQLHEHRIVELLRIGWSYRAIAAELGTSHSAIGRFALSRDWQSK